MIETIFNLFVVLVIFTVSVAFAVLMGLFLFILFACVYIGWKEIRGMKLSDIWERIAK